MTITDYDDRAEQKKKERARCKVVGPMLISPIAAYRFDLPLHYFFFLMIRRPPRSTRRLNSFPTRRSSDLLTRRPESVMRWTMFTSSTSSSVSGRRSEEHTSELQSPIDSSYAVFCWKKKTDITYPDDPRVIVLPQRSTLFVDPN